MKTKLIMLPNPILVSDEKIIKEDKCITLATFRIYTAGITPETKLETDKKIIAGIDGLPTLDLSLIAEQIGWVDVEKLAESVHPNPNPDNLTLTNTLQILKNNYISGFKAAQSLNEKKYSEEELKQALIMAKDTVREGGKDLAKYSVLNIIKSMKKPKEYDVEVEMEWISNDNEEHCVYFEQQSKITNNTIKVTKIIKQL